MNGENLRCQTGPVFQEKQHQQNEAIAGLRSVRTLETVGLGLWTVLQYSQCTHRSGIKYHMNKS